MYRFILLWAIIGVYIVKCQDALVKLNLSKVNTNYFISEEQGSDYYTRVLYTPKPGYKVNEVVDSGVKVYKVENDYVLKDVDVYFRDFLPQLVKLNLTKSAESKSLYYKRENGVFVSVEETQFNQLVNSGTFANKSVSLDLDNDFSDKIFILSKVNAFGGMHDQYVLKKDITLLKFTKGTDVLVDTDKGQKLVKLVWLKSTDKNTVLQVVVSSTDSEETSKFYEQKNGVWESVDETTVKQLYETSKPADSESSPTGGHSETDHTSDGQEDREKESASPPPADKSPDSGDHLDTRPSTPPPEVPGSDSGQSPSEEGEKDEKEEKQQLETEVSKDQPKGEQRGDLDESLPEQGEGLGSDEDTEDTGKDTQGLPTQEQSEKEGLTPDKSEEHLQDQDDSGKQEQEIKEKEKQETQEQGGDSENEPSQPSDKKEEVDEEKGEKDEVTEVETPSQHPAPVKETEPQPPLQEEPSRSTDQQEQAEQEQKGQEQQQEPPRSGGHQRQSGITLDLEEEDDERNYSIFCLNPEAVLVTKDYLSKIHILMAVKYKQFKWVPNTDDGEEKFNDVTATFFNKELRTLKLVIALTNKLTRTKYYDVKSNKELDQRAYNDLNKELEKEEKELEKGSQVGKEGSEEDQKPDAVERVEPTSVPTQQSEPTFKETKEQEADIDETALDQLDLDLNLPEEEGDAEAPLHDTAGEQLIQPHIVQHVRPQDGPPSSTDQQDQTLETDKSEQVSQKQRSPGRGGDETTSDQLDFDLTLPEEEKKEGQSGDKKEEEPPSMDEILNNLDSGSYQSLSITKKSKKPGTDDIEDKPLEVDEELLKRLRETRKSLTMDDLRKSLLTDDSSDKYESIGLKPEEYSVQERSDEEEFGGTEGKEVPTKGRKEGLEGPEQQGVERLEEVSRHQPEKTRIDANIRKILAEQDPEKLLLKNQQELQETPGFQRQTEISLDLAEDDNLFDYNVQKFEQTNGYVTKIYFPKVHNLVSVKYKQFEWVPNTDDGEEKCNQVTATYMNKELRALELSISLNRGFFRNKYYDVRTGEDLNLKSYNELLEKLNKEGQTKTLLDGEPLVLNLDLVLQDHVNVENVTAKHKHPYKIYRPEPGYVFTGVLFKKNSLWTADPKYPYSNEAILYSQLNEPGYLQLNTPTSNSFEKSLTFDLVRLTITNKLERDQIRHILETGDGQYHPKFDLLNPILHEYYKVKRSKYKDCILREFTVKYGRVVAVLDNGARITPSNAVPFMHLNVYYYNNNPIYVITDPTLYPNHYFRTAFGWRASLSYDMDENLEIAKKLTEDTNYYPVQELKLNFEDPEKGKYIIESWEKDETFMKSFMATGNNTITNITCNDAPVLDEKSGVTAAGVKFYLKSGVPFKAELLVNAKKGKKLVFKVFLEREKKIWASIDEDHFKNV